MTTRARANAAHRTAADTVALFHPEEYARFYAAALRGQDATALERLCGCGQPIRRASVTARWPRGCDQCREVA